MFANVNNKRSMRTEIIEILQKKYPEYCMQHIDTADEILRLFSVVGQSEQLVAFLEWLNECGYAKMEKGQEKFVVAHYKSD
jgi:hypothetical protein